MRTKKNPLKTLCVISMLNNLDQFMTHLLYENQIDIIDAFGLVSDTLLEEIEHENNVFQMKDDNEMLALKRKVDYVCRIAELEPATKRPAIMSVLTNEMHVLCHKIVDIYKEIVEIERRLTVLSSELEELETIEYAQLIDEIKVEDKDIHNLGNFICKVGVMSKQSYKRMSHNFENIYAMIFYLGTLKGDELHLLVIPNKLSGQIHRVLNSLGFEEFPLLTDYIKKSESTRSYAFNRMEAIKREQRQLETQLASIISENKTDIQACKSLIEAYLALGKVQSKLLMTRHFFVTAISVPATQKKEIMDRIEPFMKEAIVIEV